MLFLLVIFLLLNSSFVFVPGVAIHLPEAANLPGTAQPTLAVVVDQGGQYYFDNQIADAAQLEAKLRDAVARAREPLTLVVQADENVNYRVLAQLWLIARSAGVNDLLQATRPPLVPGAKTPRP